MNDCGLQDLDRSQLPCAVWIPHALTRALSGACAVITAIVVLGAGAAPTLAATGSVYYDAKNNVAAGLFQFNGTFTGLNNVGLGYDVMPSLTTGNGDIAVGNGSLNHVTTGLRNISIDGLFYNTTGSDNVASGFDALNSNIAGNANIASGFYALSSNTTGDNNIATGYQALYHATGNRNIALGANAGANLTTGSDNVDIVSPGVAGESGTIRIGTAKQTKVFLTGVYGNALQGQTVVVNQNGRLGTAPVAAPARSQTLARLRAENSRQSSRLGKQSTELRQMRGAIQQLREQVRKGG